MAFPNTTDTIISFTDGTRTFTIAPVLSSFYYYIHGIKYTKTTSENVIIADVEGIWYIYYEYDVLMASQTWDFTGPYALVAMLYWDTTNHNHIVLGEERHGLTANWEPHVKFDYINKEKTEVNNFAVGDYTLSGNGSSDLHSQISFTNGYINNDDLRFHVINAVSPINQWEQKLSTIAYIPLYYRHGDGDTGAWRKLSATSFPVAYQEGNTIKYNEWTGSTWQLTNAISTYYVVVWIFATNNIFEPIIGIIGQNQSDTMLASEISNDKYVLESMINTPFPFIEYEFLYRLTFRTDSSYSNTPKAVLISIRDFNTLITVTAGIAGTNFCFSKDGGAGSGTYLRTGAVQSSNAGQNIRETVYLVEMAVSASAVSSGSATRYQLQRRTAVGTRVDIAGAYVDLPNGSYTARRKNLQLTIGPDWEICAYVKSGAGPNNPVLNIFVLPAA